MPTTSRVFKDAHDLVDDAGAGDRDHPLQQGVAHVDLGLVGRPQVGEPVQKVRRPEGWRTSRHIPRTAERGAREACEHGNDPVGLDPPVDPPLELAPAEVVLTAESEVDGDAVVSTSTHRPAPPSRPAEQLESEAHLQRSLDSLGGFKGSDRPQKTPFSSDTHLSA